MYDITSWLMIVLTLTIASFGCFLIWQHFRNRKPKSSILLGYILELETTPEGLRARGMLNEQGMAMVSKKGDNGVSGSDHGN